MIAPYQYLLVRTIANFWRRVEVIRYVVEGTIEEKMLRGKCSTA